MASYLTYRTRTLQGFKEQLFPKSFRKRVKVQTAFSPKPIDKKFEDNVKTQMSALSKVSFFTTTEVNCGLKITSMVLRQTVNSKMISSILDILEKKSTN